MLYDLIIIGAGPAGLTAGLYSARKKIKTLILTENVGGQILETAEIDNYIGLPEISGLELMQKMQKHLEKYSAVILSTGKKVTKIACLKKDKQNYFKIYICDKEIYQAKSVILANGRQHRSLKIPGEKEFKGRGVSFCSTCDAPFFSNKTIAVVGTGNSGLESALSLSKFAKKIYLISNLDRMIGDKILQEKVEKDKKIEILYNTAITDIQGDMQVKNARIKTLTEPSSERVLAIEGVFVHIGYEPDTKWLEKLVELNKRGEIKIDANNMTSQKGIFAAGDASDLPWKQIIIATGEGAKAVLGVEKYLNCLNP